jgi:hypothetical protein
MSAITDLLAYMTFRRDMTEELYPLTLDYYAQRFEKGEREFFGVKVSDTAIVRDTPRPGIFAAWFLNRVAKDDKPTTVSIPDGTILQRDIRPGLLVRFFNLFRWLGIL